MKPLSKVVEITPDVFWVGVEDWHRRIFDGFMSLPYGTSYNAYLVVGGDKKVLVDTVQSGFEDIFIRKIEQVVKPESIDYVVMNHAEPDHAGAIPYILSIAKDAKLISTSKGVKKAEEFYEVASERTMTVKDGDELDLGGKSLKFIEAPWLHWPETMFTLHLQGQVLFTCDFFGAHLASDRLFDDEVDGILLPEAKRYYAEIMMPLLPFVQKALDKMKGLAVKIIAPSHGPIYRNPQLIIDAYEDWARGALKPKVVVVYVSMWGSTKTLEKTIVEAIASEGAETIPYDLTVADISHIARDLVDASGVVIGSPTLLGGPHPLIAYALELIRMLKPRGRLAAIFGSYGWGGGAANQIKSRLQSAGFEIIDAFEVLGKPKKGDLERAESLGRLVGNKIKESIKL